jgi:tetratricopeptide (TPR) repeat protein
MTQSIKQPCAYHPTVAAQWTCPACNIDFCPGCIRQVERGSIYGGAKLQLCPKCSREVSWMGVGHLIEPFWSRLPKIFVYPFSLQALMLIAGIALLKALLSGPGMLQWIANLVLWGVLIKYSYEALRATARGSLTPPKITWEIMNEGLGGVILKQGVLYFALMLAFIFVVGKLGAGFGLLFMVLALLSVPAMIILLAATDSVAHALNPVLFASMAFRIGWGYLLMYLFLALLAAAPGLAGHYIIRFMPEGLQYFLVAFAQAFYTLVSYHLMGYVLLQYHAEIGYEIDHEDFVDPTAAQAAPPAEDGESRLLREIEVLVKEGNLAEAVSAIQNATRSQGIQGLPLSERYFNLLRVLKRSADLAVYAPHHLKQLVAGSQRAKAIETYRLCLVHDRGFVPEAATLMKLAGMLSESGKGQDAVAAYSRFTKSYPSHPSAPMAYFRAAQVFHDRLMDPARSKQILQAVIKKYPGHEIIPQVQNYLTSM